MKRGPIVEHADPAGICRVCAAPASPPHGLRTDELRVCVNEACRQEARRRDGVAKQRRYTARLATKGKAEDVDTLSQERR